eukprot:CAMPEP_0118966934 /NCGR_PEP_ID=MMETSP1173-20130426/4375_1 /TAXON_ID=1034831 /ORGANISM="Rhizochromulina marina cf, Strain CCMP1243" /LENGTH=246 /DNA_ID=CAMNT_0006915813 /DNA_START=22 /DNA_END=762 /DNA_ORIENTATION=-
MRLLAGVVGVAGLAVALAELDPASQLSSGCFGLPEKGFGLQSNIAQVDADGEAVWVSRAAGDSAVDFTLYDLAGNEVTLSTLLEDKPVALIWGMWTCPAFQGLRSDYPFDQNSRWEEWDVVEKYKDVVTFLHLVGPEPHPLAPDQNFDKGYVWMESWSTVRQPTNYDERLVLANKVAEYVHPDATVLADLYPGNSYAAADVSSNPVWCTMGLHSRSALLVDQDGTITFSQSWFRKDDLSAAIDALV